MCQAAAKIEAVFRCAVSSDGNARQLEIPQWMFDRAHCCLMHLVQLPVVGVADLRALRVLLRQVARANSVEDQHRSWTCKGDADAQDTPPLPDTSLGSLSPAAADADVGGTPSADET